MKIRVSSALALGIALPSLLAGALAGILLRSQSTTAAGGPAMRLPALVIEQPTVRPPAPAPAESGKAPSSAPDSVPTTAARLRAFGTLCRQSRPKDDLYRIVTQA